MEKGEILLKERDIKLLKFLADYKTITLDNSSYIYQTKTYQEKRICRLVKGGYISRLKHREITLGKEGRKFLMVNGIIIKEHCRNIQNLERLKVISDIAAFTQNCSILDFKPSWKFKSEEIATQSSRRYLGKMKFEDTDFYIYSIYGTKNDKYITSIYYDLKKEKDICDSIIFTNNIEKILHHKKEFFFSPYHLYLIKYNDFNKRLIRNYNYIMDWIYKKLTKNHVIEKTNTNYMDFITDNKLYLKIMLFVDSNQLYCIKEFFKSEFMARNNTYIICFEENVKHIEHFIGEFRPLLITKSEIENLLNEKNLK